MWHFCFEGTVYPARHVLSRQSMGIGPRYVGNIGLLLPEALRVIILHRMLSVHTSVPEGLRSLRTAALDPYGRRNPRRPDESRSTIDPVSTISSGQFMTTRAILGCVLLLAIPLKAQDRQFWDQAVGGRAALLGGVAVAGVRDYSATFYNPGALSFLTRKGLNVNFNMYGIKDFSFINGGGPDIDSRYTRVSLYPASLAGPLPFLGDSLNRFSYMISSTGYSYVRVSERYEGYADVIPTRPPSSPGERNGFEGDEYLINQGKLDVLLSEVTVGFGYATKIAYNVGIGFSLLGAYRDQTKTRYECVYGF